MIEEALDRVMEERYGATACGDCGEPNPDAQTSDVCKGCYGEGSLPDDQYDFMCEEGML